MAKQRNGEHRRWNDVKDQVLGAGKKRGKQGEDEPQKHEQVGTTVGGIKAKGPAVRRPELDSVYYKEARGGNRNKPLD